MQPMSPKVLVADDSLPVHQVFRDALSEGHFHKIVHAFDGLECLEALDQGMDIAFIDIHMPKMSGMDALWAARTAGNKTFVTLISGRSNQRCVQLARKLDAYELLIKPFGNAEIDAIVKTYQRIYAPMRVLLVDDSQSLLKIMRKVLAKSIFHLDIEAEHEPSVALARCREKPFDVVFLDANMPGLDGIQTLSGIMRMRPQTKVVMMSGEHNTPREHQALNLGAVATMHKPFFPTEIDAILHQIFGLRSPKLATIGQIRNFEINIHGRTVAVQHTDTGHIYEYVWFRDPPHLRLPLVRENDRADIPAGNLTTDVHKVAMLELENAGLLDGAHH